MNDEVKLWLEVLTNGKVPVDDMQARAILWLAIGHAALVLQAAIRATATAPVAAVKPAPAPAPASKTKRQPKTSRFDTVYTTIQRGASTYAAIRAAMPTLDPKLAYRCVDYLVARGRVTRAREGKEVRLAAR